MVHTAGDFAAAIFGAFSARVRPWRRPVVTEGPGLLPESSVLDDVEAVELPANGRPSSGLGRAPASTSLRAVFDILGRRRRMVSFTLGGLVLACLLYCLLAPRQYDATARVALRTMSGSSLSFDDAGQRPT